MSDAQEKKLEELIQRGLKLAKNEEAAKNILALLFPRVESVAKTFVPSLDVNRSERMRKRRISLSDYSENYFLLSPTEETWGQAEFSSAIGSTPNEAFQALDKRLAKAAPENQSDIRRMFVELLDAEFSSHKAIDDDWLKAIVAESPQLIATPDRKEIFLFHVDNDERLRWLIVNALERLPTNQRATLVKAAIRSASDLSLLSDVVRYIAGDLHPKGGADKLRRADFGEETDEVRQELIMKIENLAAAGEIWNQAKPGKLLWFWWGANKEDDVRAFTSRAMNTSLGLLTLLQIIPGAVISSSESYERVSKSWENIVDLEALKERALIQLRTGNSEERAISQRFLTALERGNNENF
ncbi:MAG: hypothetical protein WBF99_05035 [Xanthobacteraceae bacterium]